MHTKYLKRATLLQQWLDHHQETIRLAHQMPMTQTVWGDSVGTVVDACNFLRVHPSTLHELIVSGVIADAERQIAEINEELALYGVTDKTASSAGPVPALPFVVIEGGASHATVEAMRAITGRVQKHAPVKKAKR